MAAVYVSNAGKDTLYYAHTDYQGSLTALSLPNGTVVERYAYDPWGKRRNPGNWTQTDTRTAFILNRGYTMHEHLPEFNLINMNGRVYDPLTAMFFSPDPYLQAPGNWLNYNRYGYCLNNPFLYTDPDGEFFLMAVFLGAMINTAVQGASGNLGGMGSFWKAMGTGALSGAAGAGAGAWMSSIVAPVGIVGGGLTGAAGGAAGGFVGGAGNAWANGASLGAGLKSGLTGGAWGALGGGILGGISGGIIAYIHGGNILTGEGARFTSDFLGTGITEAKNASINTNEQILKLLEEKGVNLTELNVNSVSIEGEVTIPEGDFYYYRGDDGIVYKVPINGGTSTTIGGVTHNTIHNLRPVPANIFLSPHNSIPNLMIMNHSKIVFICFLGFSSIVYYIVYKHINNFCCSIYFLYLRKSRYIYMQITCKF